MYLTTTCTEAGHGIDYDPAQNGEWTYYFLEYSWQIYYESDVYVSMEDVFDYAHDNYEYDYDIDIPQEFDGSPGITFYMV